MAEGGATLILFVICLAACCSVTAVRRMLAARRFRRVARAERIRSGFADARNKLVRLALEGESRSDSETFRVFYFLNTMVMRRPDKYEEMWTALLTASRQVEPANVSLLQEARQWSEPVARMALATLGAMDAMIVEHSLALRLLARLVAGAQRRAGRPPVPLLILLHEAAARRLRREVTRRRESEPRLQWTRSIEQRLPPVPA